MGSTMGSTMGRNVMGQNPVIGRVSAEDQAALAVWRERVERMTPAERAQLGEIRFLHEVGDSAILYPRVDLARLDELPLEARAAVRAAEAIVREAQAERRLVVQSAPGSGRATPLQAFDPAAVTGVVLIGNPIVGG